MLASECQVDLLLVDEAQDLTPMQHRACCHLARNGELIVTGDAAQSVYGFRGADPSGFADFPHGPPRDTNHRSARSIVTFANALPIRERLTQRYHHDGDGAVRWGIVQTDDDDDLARAAALLVAQEQALPSSPATTAILCRNNREVRRVIAAARAMSLPVRWNARRYLHASPAVAAVLAYTEHLMGGRLKAAAIEPVLAWVGGAPDGWLQTLIAEGDPERALALATRQGLVDPAFLRGHNELGGMSPGVPLRRKLRAIVEKLDLIERLRHKHADGVEADALVALLDLVGQSDDLTLQELRHLVRVRAASAAEPDPSWRSTGTVALTIHDAKGLEWDSVLVPFFQHSGRRPPPPVLIDPQSSTCVRVGLRDIRLNNDPRRILSRSEREIAVAEGASLTRLPDAVYSELSWRARADEHAESLRLDYVAITRARRRLTIAIACADAKWPLPLKHLYDAVAETKKRHPNSVSAIAGRVGAPAAVGVSRRARQSRPQLTVESPRPLAAPLMSPTRLERLINGR